MLYACMRSSRQPSVGRFCRSNLSRLSSSVSYGLAASQHRGIPRAVVGMIAFRLNIGVKVRIGFTSARYGAETHDAETHGEGTYGPR